MTEVNDEKTLRIIAISATIFRFYLPLHAFARHLRPTYNSKRSVELITTQVSHHASHIRLI